jgi:hypothetical protein
MQMVVLEYRKLERPLLLVTMDGAVRNVSVYYGVAVASTLDVLASELGLCDGFNWCLSLRD